MPIGNFACALIKGETPERQQGPDHVFADSLCLSFGLSSDLAADVETCVVPVEGLLDQGKADEGHPGEVSPSSTRPLLTSFGMTGRTETSIANANYLTGALYSGFLHGPRERGFPRQAIV